MLIYSISDLFEVVTGTIVTSIGVHLGYSAFMQATTTPFDTYMGLATAIITMLISVYAPWPALRRMQVASSRSL